MAGYGYGGYGAPFGAYGGGNVQQTFEQERVGYGPQGYGIYEQESQVNRNPFTGATTIVQENEFIPARGVGGFSGGVGGFPGGVGGFPGGAGGFAGYGGYGGGYGNRFF